MIMDIYIILIIKIFSFKIIISVNFKKNSKKKLKNFNLKNQKLKFFIPIFKI